MRRRPSSEHGFSLLESLIAVTLIAAGVLSIVQLFGLAAAMNVSARRRTTAAILAAQKLEELRTAWPMASGADFVDARGAVLSSGGQPPPQTAFVRRWTIDPVPAHPGTAWVLHVTVAGGVREAASGDVRLVTVRTRTSR